MSTAERHASVPVRDAQSVAFELAALGALLPKFAHDCNNRLTVILSCLDLLGEMQVEDADLKEVFALADDAARQLASEVSTLLGLARRPCAPPEALDAGAFVEGLVDWMRRADGARVEFAGRQPATTPTLIVADRDGLLAVLLCVHNLAISRGAHEVRVDASIVDQVAPGNDDLTSRAGRHCRLVCRWSGAEVEPDRHEFRALVVYLQALRGRVDVATGPDTELRVELNLPVID
jgi:hypothetical protein